MVPTIRAGVIVKQVRKNGNKSSTDKACFKKPSILQLVRKFLQVALSILRYAIRK